VLERIKLGMWKSSHVRLAKYLADQQEFSCLSNHRLGFFLGSILPDCIPSFITRRHRIQDTFFILKEELQKIESCSKADFYFCLHLGIVLHYVADYFTYPHNCAFDGTFFEHCIWEWQQQKSLKSLLQKPLGFSKSEMLESKDLIKYLLKMHHAYLKEGISVTEDCKYVVEVCHAFVTSAIYFGEVQIPLVVNKYKGSAL